MSMWNFDEYGDLGFPTTETEQDYFKNIKKTGKKPNIAKPTMKSSYEGMGFDLGFDMNLDNAELNSVGIPSLPNMEMNFWNNPNKSKKIKNAPQYEPPSDSSPLSLFGDLFKPQAQPANVAKYKGSKKYGKQKPTQNSSGATNVIAQSAKALNKRLSKRAEKKRFEKSQPNAQELQTKRKVEPVHFGFVVTYQDGTQEPVVANSYERAEVLRRHLQGRNDVAQVSDIDYY